MSQQNGGGLGSGIERTRYQTDAPLRYQRGAGSLAVDRRREFFQFIRDMARYVRPWAVTKREIQVCDDAMREVPRLSVDGLHVLVELAARCGNAGGNPLVLVEGFKGAVFQRMAAPSPLPCLFEISDAENESNHALNRAQTLLDREKDSPVRLVQTRENAVQQAYQTIRLIESIDWRLGQRLA